jgi:hypothetical protein
MVLSCTSSSLLLLGSSAATAFVARLDLAQLRTTDELNRTGFKPASLHGFFQIEFSRNVVDVDSVFI